MYIIRRAAQVAGLDGLEWATKITGVVQDAGMGVSLWVAGPGGVPGAVAWSVPVEGFADWSAKTEQMLADPTYQEVARAGRDVIVGFESDVAMQIIHGELGEPAQVGQFIGAIRASVNPDRSAEAGVFAVEIADAWTATTGIPAIVATYAAGDMSTIEWLARHEDAASIDAANAKLAASESYAAALAKGNGLFTGGHQMYARRAA